MHIETPQLAMQNSLAMSCVARCIDEHGCISIHFFVSALYVAGVPDYVSVIIEGIMGHRFLLLF